MSGVFMIPKQLGRILYKQRPTVRLSHSIAYRRGCILCSGLYTVEAFPII